MNQEKVTKLKSQPYQSEATLTKKVREYLTARKDLFFWKASDRFQKGIPDIIVCVQGNFVGIELKTAVGSPSAQQKIFIKKINNAGGVAAVCRSVADVEEALQEALKQ